MADIDVVIIDPGGYRFQQRLDNYMAMRALVPLLVSRLGLPTELKYQLIPKATGHPMQLTDTLAGIGVPPGAEIQLKPLRDDVFVKILDDLYEKAEKYVAEKLWQLAKHKLDEVFRLDPHNSDPKGLKQTIEIHLGVTAATPPVTPQAQPSAGAPAQASNVGCWVIIIIAVVALFVWKPWNASNSNSNKQKQTKGSFTAELVPVGQSYYFRVTAKSGENISVSVRGTDGFPDASAGQVADFTGAGSLSTSVIPPGKPGIRDTITVKSLDTGEQQEFWFDF